MYFQLLSVLLILVQLVSSQVKLNESPLTLSPIEINRFENVEAEIYSILKNFQNSSENIKIYTSDYEECQDLNGIYNGANPFCVFKMAWRFTNFLKPKNELKFNDDLEKKFETIEGYQDLPRKKILYQVISNVLRYQNFYNLETLNLNLEDFGVNLSSNQTYEIAKYAMNKNYFNLAFDWLELTSNLDSSRANKINLDLRNMIKKHDDQFTIYRNNEMFKYLYSDKITSFKHFQIAREEGFLRKMTKYNLKDLNLKPTFDTLDQKNIIALCNGEDFLTSSERSKLYCHYDNGPYGFSRLSPIKTEILSVDPKIVRIYDFIGDSRIEDLKRVSQEKLERPPKLKSINTTKRCAMYAWLEDSVLGSNLRRVISKIEAVTGYTVAGSLASTSLQVASYAFGGFVEPHWDSLGEEASEHDPRGNRLMTFLIYMNDVDQGGLTVFPLLGLSIKPIKGSAILWHLAYKNGDVDRRTFHTACPVSHGQKWIATKWIHLNQNFLKRPCSLNNDGIS